MKRIITALCSALLAASINAQPLTLFEPLEATTTPQQQAAAQQSAIRRPGQQPNEPVFSLRSTSKFGDQYRTTLVNRDGTTVRIQYEPGRPAQVLGHPGFAVLDVSPRQVTLELPASEPCIENRDKGVSCVGPNLATLTLSNAAPIRPAQPQQARGPAVPVRGVAFPEGVSTAMEAAMAEGAVVMNPFTGEVQAVQQLTPEERAMRAQMQAERAGQLRDLQQQRIADDQIPPGMRRVRTPFGDRLVREN